MKKDWWDISAIIGSMFTGVGTLVLSYAAIKALPDAASKILDSAVKNEKTAERSEQFLLMANQGIEELRKFEIRFDVQDPKSREALLGKYNIKLDTKEFEKYMSLSAPDAEAKINSLMKENKSQTIIQSPKAESSK